MSYTRPLLIAAAAALVAAAPLAASDHDRDRTDQLAARAALARGEIVPIQRILASATAAVPGDVLKVALKRKPTGFRYDVKILAGNGRVREVEIDARTARVLEIEDD